MSFPCEKNKLYKDVATGSVKPMLLKEYGLFPYGWGVLGFCSRCKNELTFMNEDTGKTEFRIRPCMEAEKRQHDKEIFTKGKYE